MSRLKGILSLLCLLLATWQVECACGGMEGFECVVRSRCNLDLGFGTLEASSMGCAATEICCLDSLIIINTVGQVDEVSNTDCGRRNSYGESTGFAQEAEIPWMVALLRSNLSYMAGGALIADNVVITAAQVLGNLSESDLIVRAGEWDFKTTSETYGHVDVGIRKIVRHPDVDLSNGANNLAILFLKDRIKLAKNINPICLPNEKQYPDFRECIFTGWGPNMDLMRKVELPVEPNDVCERKMGNFYGLDFHNSLMCAGGEEVNNFCQGVGGSPLACPMLSDPTRYELAGVMNFGVGCGERGYPIVYTSIAKLKSWIIQEGYNNFIQWKPPNQINFNDQQRGVNSNNPQFIYGINNYEVQWGVFSPPTRLPWTIPSSRMMPTP